MEKAVFVIWHIIFNKTSLLKIYCYLIKMLYLDYYRAFKIIHSFVWSLIINHIDIYCPANTYRVARSPVFCRRSQISALVSCLPKGSTRQTKSLARLIGWIYKLICGSKLHHASWCDEHKSFMQLTMNIKIGLFFSSITDKIK